MLKFASYDIVFQEVPNEVTLALNLTQCPNRCAGCHSPHLRENIGTELTEAVLSELVERYADAITCVCFMGGDASPESVAKLAAWVKQRFQLKTAWYSGCDELPEHFDVANFDYVKIGAFIEYLGGLTSPKTNQRFYQVKHLRLEDITSSFQHV